MGQMTRRAMVGAVVVSGALAVQRTAAQSGTPAANLDANKEIVRRWFEQVINQAALDAMDAIVADGYEPTNPADIPGRDALKQRVADTVGERSIIGRDAQFVVDDLIAERDMIAARWHTEGGYTDAAGLSVFQIDNERIVRIWQPTDSIVTSLRLS